MPLSELICCISTFYATATLFNIYTYIYIYIFFTIFIILCHSGAGPLACTSCPLHFMLDGGLCMECLGSQYYDSPTQTCKTCHDSCRSCSGPGQYSCKTCAFPLHLDRLNNQCVPCCPTDAAPEDQSCCHCDKDTGKCVCMCVFMCSRHFQKPCIVSCMHTLTHVQL